jgi:nucleotide-binding universal stress UspA family protein
VKRILVALDESEASAHAAEFVNSFFSDRDEYEILALNVASIPVPWVDAGIGYAGVYPYSYSGPYGPGTDADVITEVELARGEEAIEASGVASGEHIVEFGEPVSAISAAAVDHDVDLIVVGSHDKGFFKRVLVGSVSEGLVRKAPRPVLVVR